MLRLACFSACCRDSGPSLWRSLQFRLFLAASRVVLIALAGGDAGRNP
jgi:hypothetical protein